MLDIEICAISEMGFSIENASLSVVKINLRRCGHIPWRSLDFKGLGG